MAELTKEDIVRLLREEHVDFKLSPTKSELEVLLGAYRGDLKKLLRKRLKELMLEELRIKERELKLKQKELKTARMAELLLREELQAPSLQKTLQDLVEVLKEIKVVLDDLKQQGR